MKTITGALVVAALAATGGSAFAKKSRYAMPATHKGASTSGSGGAFGKTGATQTGAGPHDLAHAGHIGIL